MLDGESTTFDWQRAGGDVCILPIGSFEQHGHHMPLATDNILVEHSARHVASELPAALLATLPYGTCFEHSGYRGSMGLRPETLMAIVRDIADACERQGFRVLIILSGHGGNFCLGPVVRDINRQDRGIKLLLPGPLPGEAPDVLEHPAWEDYHAGEGETSCLLHVRPELVRDERHDRPPPDGELALQQADLNHFGIGHQAPDGALGYPSDASAEKGAALIKNKQERLLVWLRDRIARLESQPSYGPPR